MSLAARLSKLEERAPALLRCAWCLYALVNTPASEADKTPETGGYVLRHCPFCGTEYRTSVRGYAAREVEAFLLWDGKVSGETYSNERAYAAMEWCTFRSHARAIRRRQERDERAASKPFAGHKPKPEVKETKEVREYRERKDRAFALLNRNAERQERLYGPRTFPLAARLKELEKEPRDFQLDEEKRFRSSEEKTALWLRSFYERMAACELVLWGEVEPETAAEIERLTAEAERLAVKRRDEAREEKERRERKAAEREEKYRVEREQRERERVARLAPTPQPSAMLEEAFDGGTQYVPGEDKPDPGDVEFWGKAVRRAQMVYIPPEEAPRTGGVSFGYLEAGAGQGPQPPPDDGSDYLYQVKLARWKRTGVWPDEDMLRAGR